MSENSPDILAERLRGYKCTECGCYFPEKHMLHTRFMPIINKTWHIWKSDDNMLDGKECIPKTTHTVS